MLQVAVMQRSSVVDVHDALSSRLRARMRQTRASTLVLRLLETEVVKASEALLKSLT